MLNKRDDILKRISIDDSPINYLQVDVWSKSEKNYDCYVFVYHCNNVEDLEASWQYFSNDIAVRFQSKLQKPIEIWNIYLVFIVRDVVLKEVKYKIEQDKYSCRKVVIDNVNSNITQENIINKIMRKLFQLSINTRSEDEENIDSVKSNEKSLMEKLDPINSRLSALINKGIEPSLIYNLYLKEGELT
ncbi:ABC-three component system middle component 1 [Paenibacillus tundrae]|uniref:ABC-three component system middle component 1 n=1 Tax=Paenibacillus tundrae TaxID=528187 RepID=UPI0030CC7E4A